jgi:mycoredoxin
MQQMMAAIQIYGTNWCPDSLRAQRMLDREGVPYQYIDIDKNQDAEAVVMRTNRGNRSVPTIFFPDGTVFVEPGGSLLRAKIIELRERGFIPPPASGDPS